jgi:hypothetical protein
MEVRECRRHPSAILWLYRNGKRVQSLHIDYEMATEDGEVIV